MRIQRQLLTTASVAAAGSLLPLRARNLQDREYQEEQVEGKDRGVKGAIENSEPGGE